MSANDLHDRLAPNEAVTVDAIVGRTDGLLRLELPALPLASYGDGPLVFEPCAYLLTVHQALYGTGAAGNC